MLYWQVQPSSPNTSALCFLKIQLLASQAVKSSKKSNAYLSQSCVYRQTGASRSEPDWLQEVMWELPQLAASICALGVDERLLPDGALSRKSPLPKKEDIMCLCEVSLHPGSFNVFLMWFRDSWSIFFISEWLMNSCILEVRCIRVEISQTGFVNRSLIQTKVLFVRFMLLFLDKWL